MISSRYSSEEIELLEKLSTYTSATVYEALGQVGAVSSSIKPLDSEMKVCGFAYTVQGKPADNLTLHHAIYKAEPSEVIVASVKEYSEAGYWGDIMTSGAIAQSIRGLVFDGSVRDSEEIIKSGFPVFCKGTCIKGTQKTFKGKHCEPIVLGGVLINQGDFILGDRDGVVVIPRERLFEITKYVDARIEKEEQIKDKLKNGENTIDIYGLMSMN